jgi:uncharacterized membrane protein
MTEKPSKAPRTEADKPAPSHDKVGLERLIFFSDAVFAIAITLLALDIRLPPLEVGVSDRLLLDSLISVLPKFMGYVISFLVIGVFWIGHHRKFRLIVRYDSALMLLNLFFLMTIAFIPFPTAVLSEYGNRTATILYASTMTLVGLLMGAMWAYASHNHRLVDAHLSRKQIRREMLRTQLTTSVFLLSIVLAFFDSNIAKLSWLFIIVFLRFVW